jgi:hypothetical protein
MSLLKVERYESTKERAVLVGMVTDAAVLGRIASRWKGDLFLSPYANAVAGMCVEHFRAHGVPPGRGITSLFASWAEEGRSEDTVALVESFLTGLSDEYERSDPPAAPHVLDMAGEHFNRVRLIRLREELDAHLQANNLEKAEQARAACDPVDLGPGSNFDLLGDRAAVEACFREADQIDLFSYPEALGNFFRGTLQRDFLLAFFAPEKTGKSWWLMDLAYRALLGGNRVAYFDCGDMSEEQVGRRFLSRVAEHPYIPGEDGLWPYAAKVPNWIEPPGVGDECAHVNHDDRVFDGPLSFKIAWRAARRLIRQQLGTSKNLRTSFHPNSTINVAGIREKLVAGKREGWIPDVVVIDYADILANPPGRYENGRDAINATWKQLRALSQELHCLVVTATQADADSYDKKLLSRKNFSEDKRKFAHVNAMCGINVTAAEKEREVYRLNWVMRREGPFSWNKVVHAAGCLAVGNPAVKSCF